MKMIMRYMSKYKWAILLVMLVKLIGTMFELLIPYILEYMIDDVVPLGDMKKVVYWGVLMFVTSFFCWVFNVAANAMAVNNAHKVSYNARQDLFVRTTNLSGTQFDATGLPSLISRMTSDSYNVQSAVQLIQSLCVRAPIMLIGGLFMTLIMDWHLAMILVIMLPFLTFIIFYVSLKGIPMFRAVQGKLDVMVRIVRENITGIRVVKALGKTEYEMNRFGQANNDMAKTDIKASTFISIPGPVMQLFLNTGLVLVVLIGGRRVNLGLMAPGVILAFLTYFNMITMGVMGISRIFIMLSRAAASAGRIDEVIQTSTDQLILSEDQAKKPSGDGFIRFEHVSFRYGEGGEDQEKALDDIDFTINKGESLGIIGPTGCGKTTIINLLMRFYDTDEGGIFVDGRDVRTYDKDELHRRFGVAFQNDMIFKDTLRENVNFGRGLSDEDIRSAVEDAMAAEYVNGLDEGLAYEASIKGANLSGGQKQRMLVARALAAHPEILILDDSSSALDYKTDAAMRRSIQKNHKESTMILIAQRVSSVMNMNHILVMDNGKCIGYGTHEELLESCDAYREIYDTQMGAMA